MTLHHLGFFKPEMTITRWDGGIGKDTHGYSSVGVRSDWEPQ